MPTKPESRLRSKIVKYLRAKGGRWIVTHGSQYQEAGVSDLLGCMDGHFWALELKTPNKYRKPDHNLTALQVEFIDSVRRSGGVAFCICSLKQAEWLMDCQTVYGPAARIEKELEAING